MGQHTFYCIVQFNGCGGPLLKKIKNLLSTAADREALRGANEGKDSLWDKSSCRSIKKCFFAWLQKRHVGRKPACEVWPGLCLVNSAWRRTICLSIYGTAIHPSQVVMSYLYSLYESINHSKHVLHIWDLGLNLYFPWAWQGQDVIKLSVPTNEP